VDTRRLGRSGLEISRIGFGAWAAGGSHWHHGWSGQDDGDSIAAIERALAAGINWIDTAAAYGWGHSERVVARALRDVRQPPMLFTKCGALRSSDGGVEFNLAQESLRRELEASLERLEVDAVDLYQIHRPLPDLDIERGWETLASFKAEGLVRHIGVSNFTVDQIQRIAGIAPVETLQPPYSLMQREAGADLLPYAQTADVGVIIYSPMGSGLLTGTMTQARFDSLPVTDWRRNDARFAPEKLERGFELVERLRQVGDRYGASPGEVALAWALRNQAVDGAIVGFRTPEQVDGVLHGATLELGADEAEFLAA